MSNQQNDRQKVLVTGGCGFVGRHLVNALADRGDDVYVVDIKTIRFRDDVTFIDADICDAEKVIELCAGKDLIFHNASMVHTRQNHAKIVWAINHGGTLNILAGCKKHGIKKLVYNSSASVVYNGVDIENGDESAPYAANSQAPYADSKIQAEKDVLAANGVDGLATCAIRPHVIFGPHDNRFLPAILNRAENGKLKYGVGRGEWFSDFTYVSNLVDALLLAGDRLSLDSPIAGEAYFVTNGEPRTFFGMTNGFLDELGLPRVEKFVPRWLAYSVAGVAEFMERLRGGEVGVETGMTRFAIRYICSHHYFDISKAKRDLGWEPKVSLDEGIRLTVAALNREKAES